jgi:ATP-dependent protease Clp ATPase subunit
LAAISAGNPVFVRNWPLFWGNQLQQQFCSWQESPRRRPNGRRHQRRLHLRCCIELCHNLIKEERRRTSKGKNLLKTIPKPREIFDFLDQYVIGQEVPKRALSVAVHNHYKRLAHADTMDENDVELDKSNILLIGPTGSRQDAAGPHAGARCSTCPSRSATRPR